MEHRFAIRIRGHSTTTWTEFCLFLSPPPPPAWTVLYPERGQKQTFFEPLPPHLVQVVIEWTLKGNEMQALIQNDSADDSVFPT